VSECSVHREKTLKKNVRLQRRKKTVAEGWFGRVCLQFTTVQARNVTFDEKNAKVVRRLKNIVCSTRLLYHENKLPFCWWCEQQNHPGKAKKRTLALVFFYQRLY